MEFQFKQFKILQYNSVFKIGTDSIILGAWANFKGPKCILDVGCGTGVLSIMAAQKEHDADIVGIDIQTEAVELATCNFKASPFSERLSCFKENILQLASQQKQMFDYVLSNPPYFSSGVLSFQSHKNIARHNETLPIPDFWSAIDKLASVNGKVGVIYPLEEAQEFIRIGLDIGWNLNRRLNIYAKETETQTNKPKRVALEFSRMDKEFKIEELFILDKNGKYSIAYQQLTKDFYLDLVL